MFRLGEALHGRPVGTEDVEWLQEKLLFDRMPVRDRFLRFFVLIFLSGIIATYGVVSDSTADVIGAMIIAPMMTPITAISLGAISGDVRNILRSLMVVAGGTAMVIGVSYTLAVLVPGALQLAGNSQVASRTSPRLIDLIIALAAGAAGAFATSREDISDALPGVAIAVSLVPPLAVVGITLSVGEYGQAWGAMLLFLTNLVAIIAAGLGIFALMGYGSASLGLVSPKARRLSITVVIIVTLIIAMPLAVSGYNIYAKETLKRDTQNAINQWIGDTDYDIVSVKISGGEVNVIIAGQGNLPPFKELLADLEERAGKVKLNMQVVPEVRMSGETRT
ncbi:MAG: DUF389 domain-containing protein [Actinomycetota bacterium]|nr:DUF389 domain-containing protein [Actinomycetota bacterium]